MKVKVKNKNTDPPNPGPDPYDNDEYSRSHEDPKKEKWHRDETTHERDRKSAEKYFRKGEKWVKKYD